MFFSRAFNVDAHNFVGQEKLYGFKTWLEGFKIKLTS